MNTTENLFSTPQLPNNIVKPTRFPNQPQEWKIVSLKECPTPADIQLCQTPEQATAYWNLHIINHPYFNPECECLVVLILNTRHKIKGHYFVSVGTMDTILVHPREVFRLAIIASAHAIVVMHNHPSGESTTSEHGVFAFTLTDSTPYALRGDCALIENLAVFHSFERLGLEAGFAIWTGGISSNRFINWLAANVKHGLRVLHLPDYDPVGLTEFLRHHERLGEVATLFLPEDLPSLFRSHSNSSLLADQKNQRMLMKLRKARHPSIQQVVALIDECNGGLEQEAIFIEHPVGKN